MVISYYYFLFLSTLIYGVSYHQCLLNKDQEESNGNGINRIHKNSCLKTEMKKDSLWILKVLIMKNRKQNKKLYFSYSRYEPLRLSCGEPWPFGLLECCSSTGCVSRSSGGQSSANICRRCTGWAGTRQCLFRNAGPRSHRDTGTGRIWCRQYMWSCARNRRRYSRLCSLRIGCPWSLCQYSRIQS